MTLTIEATYENGVLKLDQPLPFKDHERVRVTVVPKGNWIDETYGICGWKGSSEELQELALSPEYDPQEGA